ncbi:MAG: zinc ribbon domain-containing protein, partial [Lachnospiraceae bacterium]|nr:zinc ribbon domain-containing protein [Lachnospiraceae bacterium]
MFCMECGTKLPDNAKFCMNCGSPVGMSVPIGNDTEDAEEDSEILSCELREVAEEIVEPSLVQKKPFFLKDYSSIPVHLHDPKGILQFNQYLKDGEYHFPLGKYSVDIPEYLITSLNTQAYFMRWVCCEDIDGFEEEYEQHVHGMDSFYEKGLKLFEEAQEKIATHTLK